MSPYIDPNTPVGPSIKERLKSHASVHMKAALTGEELAEVLGIEDSDPLFTIEVRDDCGETITVAISDGVPLFIEWEEKGDR